MRPKSLTPALACLPVVLAGTAQAQGQAQSDPPTRPFKHTVAVTSGVNFTDRMDETASPRPYAGVGTAAALRYRFEAGNWSLTAEAGGSRASYSPRDDLAGSESSVSGGVALSVDRSAASFHALSLRLGLTVDTRAELLEHRYADMASTLSSFVSGFSTLGPSATLTRPLGAGDVSATAVIPLVALVHQPYANTRQEHEPLSVRTVDFSPVRGSSLDLRYESSRTARLGVVAEYRLKTFDYSAGWRARSFTNATALGIVARFGARGR